MNNFQFECDPTNLMTATHKLTHRVLIEILVKAAAVALTDGSKVPTMQERTKTESCGNGLFENFHFLTEQQRQREELAVRPNLSVVVNAKCRHDRREGYAKKANCKVKHCGRQSRGESATGKKEERERW